MRGELWEDSVHSGCRADSCFLYCSLVFGMDVVITKFDGVLHAQPFPAQYPRRKKLVHAENGGRYEGVLSRIARERADWH